jgi:two-component system NtrC family response regulator
MWPGNVRQLENCVRRAVIMCDGKRLTVKDLELAPAGQGAATNLKDARENLERDMIQSALRKHSGKIAPAAAELGVSRPTLYDLMDKLGIAKE